MIQVVERIEKSVFVGNRVFRLWSDGKLEMCELKSDKPVFKTVESESYTISIVNNEI